MQFRNRKSETSHLNEYYIAGWMQWANKHYSCPLDADITVSNNKNNNRNLLLTSPAPGCHETLLMLMLQLTLYKTICRTCICSHYGNKLWGVGLIWNRWFYLFFFFLNSKLLNDFSERHPRPQQPPGPSFDWLIYSVDCHFWFPYLC